MTSTSRTSPSRIARKMAADLWPDIQRQRRLAPGVFDFSCAGHGGIVAVLEACDFAVAAVDVARKHGKMELVGDWYGHGLITTERYTAETFENLRGAGWPVWEVWVGEEDCDFALLALASEKVCAKLSSLASPGSEYATAAGMLAYCRGNAERWNPEFLADFDALGAREETIAA